MPPLALDDPVRVQHNAAHMDSLVHEIGDTPQGFVDDTMIAVSSGLERRVHSLAKHSDAPVLSSTEPCEGAFAGPVSVLFDEPTGLWRMWYNTYGERRTDLPVARSETLHLAVSRDGVEWEKPPLGAFGPACGAPNNLCVFESGATVGDARAVIEDADEPDPTRRFKLIYYCPDYYLAYSADGIRWRPAQPEPVWANGSGDGLEETSFFLRDPLAGKYRGYMRVWRRHQTIRKTSLGESDDLLSWTGPEIIWEAQPHYGPGSQIYGMNVHVDTGMYWAFPWVFYTDEPVDEALRMTMRMKLAYSRDGVAWQALAPDRDAVPMGEAGAFDSGMSWSACPPVLCPTEGRLYYGGANGRHDGSDTARAVGLARWRRGGLVSLQADDGGQLLTRRFVFRGEELRINARTEADGWIRAELLNDGGAVVKTHPLATSDVFTGDDVDSLLSWGGDGDLSGLFGQYLMLRLVMHKAEVYTFRAAGRSERFDSPLGPPPVRCGRCVAPPVVDGVLDDNCWQDFTHSGVAAEFVKYTEVAPAPVRTRALFTYDDDHLYIALECEEPSTDAVRASDAQGPVSYASEEVVEFRLSAPRHGTHVHQLMVTPTGRKQHCWFSKEAGGSRCLERADWEARPHVVEGRWSVEMAVPFQSLDAPCPAAGDTWRLNIIRYRYVDGSDISCWRCMYGSPHRTDLTGALTFLG